MKITIFDGAKTIGGNKIYVEENGRGIFLDFGMNFAKHAEYFEEFLRERSSRGVYDPLYLGLIPRLNIYRIDLIPSDVDLSSCTKPNVEAVLLSHAHLDHCGCAGFLNEDIPILASPMTLAILKAMRDIGRVSLGSEICYYSKKAPLKDEGPFKDNSRVLESSRSYKGRDFICTEKFGENLPEFLCKRPGQESNRSKKFEAGKVCCLDERDLCFEIKAFEVDHSIYGATAFIVESDSSLAYTGDLRMHGKYADRTRNFVKKAKKASILIIEGTRVSRDDEEISESDVYNNCLKIVEQSKGLVIADFSPRNFERLETFSEIAKKTSRELVVTAKDAYMLHAMEKVDGIDRMKELKIYRELKADRDNWETKVVAEIWKDKYVDPREIQREQERFILCFSYYDVKHLLDIKPDGGTYIYSSSEAFGEEQEFDFLRLGRWLELFDFKTCGFRVEGRDVYFEKGFHASGHASKEDLIKIIEKINPDVLIPVHTENAEWFAENFDLKKVRVMNNGESISF